MITTFKVTKYDCGSCAMMMEGICEDLPGVTKAEVKVRERLLAVEHDDSVTAAHIQQALAAEDYPVELP
jgi:copper chaperone CopZ